MRNRIITLAATGLAAAALSLAGMAGASASSHPTKNATLVCGFNCFNLSNLQLDATGTGSFIQNAVGGATGTSVNLRAAGIAKSNEDFQAAFNTTVGIGVRAGLPVPDVDLLPEPVIFSMTRCSRRTSPRTATRPGSASATWPRTWPAASR